MNTSCKSKAILVLGMHRSGTSAATRMINLLGADLGSRLLAPRADNEQGFWESQDAYEIDERLLTRIGRSWADVGPLPLGWENSPAAHDALGQIIAVIEREFATKPLWAIKDPRLCRLAPLWLKALKLLDIPVSVLIVTRDPWEVAKSLAARDNLDEGYSHLLATQHLFEALEASKGLPRALVTFDQLLNDWQQCAQRLSAELDIQWPVNVESAKLEIDSFLSPANRHHRAETTTPSAEEVDGADFTRQVFAACELIQTSAQQGWKQLQELSEQYRQRIALSSPALSDLTNQRNRQIADLQNLTADHQAQLQFYQTHIEKQNAELSTHSEKILELQDAALQAAGEALSAKSQAVELQSKIAELQQLCMERQVSLERLSLATQSRGWLLKKLLRPRT